MIRQWSLRSIVRESFIASTPLVFICVFACSGDQGSSGDGCPDGQVFDSFKGECRQNVAGSAEGAKGSFTCEVLATPAEVSIDGVVDVVGGFDGQRLIFGSVPQCFLTTESDGQPTLGMQLNTILETNGAREAWVLSVTIDRGDVGPGANLTQLDEPYPADVESGTFTAILSRGPVDAQGSLVSEVYAVARADAGAIRLEMGSAEVGSTISGTFDITSFVAFSTSAANGDACTTNEDCQVGLDQVCFAQSSNAPICASACLNDGDCEAFGGGSCLLSEGSTNGACLLLCEAEDDCVTEGTACLQYDETRAFCVPSDLTEDDAPCEADADCGDGQGCLLGYCFHSCELLEQNCSDDAGCIVNVDSPPGGVCVGSSGVEVGEPCDGLGACVPGATCAVADICLSLCDTRAPDCDDCREVTGFAPVGVCWIE